jgi:hypothetical protein
MVMRREREIERERRERGERERFSGGHGMVLLFIIFYLF